MIQTLFGTPQPSFLDKMKQAVTRTRENLSERIDEVMALTKEIDRATLDDLEGILLGADLGMNTTQEILSKLREKADRKQIKDAAELKKLIKEQVLAILNADIDRTFDRVRAGRNRNTFGQLRTITLRLTCWNCNSTRCQQ